MKFIVALLALFALANGQDNCARCAEGVQKLGEYLLTEDEIAAVEEGLVDLVCSTLDDPAGCARGVYAWWPSIATALFNYEGTVTAICVGVGSCKKATPFAPKQDVTCDECEAFLGKVADLLNTDEFAGLVAADLRGDVFCGDETYIQADQMEACQGFVDLAAVPAVKALGSLLRASATKICTDNGCTY